MYWRLIRYILLYLDYVDKYSKRMSKKFIWGLAVGVVLVMVTLAIIVLCKGHDFIAIRIINPSGSESILSHCDKMSVIKELEAKGVLLTPNEYTNHVVSCYNSIIACLLGSLIIFSFLGYFSMKSKLKEQIQDALEDMMRDSKKFENTILDNVYGRVTEDFVEAEDFENLKKDVQELKNITVSTKKEIIAE